MLNIDFLNNDYEGGKTAAEKVEEAISIDILTGVLKPGSRIIEDKLCEKYHMSRTPLRQIIQKIAANGLIQLIPNRGAFVIGITERDVEDYFYIRSLLYPQCVKWAIQRITEEEYSMLEETFYFMEFYTATGDMDKMHRINSGFDAIIYNACHNLQLERALLKYDFIIKYVNYGIIYPHNYLTTVLEEHRAIFNAFRDKNPDAGYEAAQIHAYKSMLRRK